MNTPRKFAAWGLLLNLVLVSSAGCGKDSNGGESAGAGAPQAGAASSRQGGSGTAGTPGGGGATTTGGNGTTVTGGMASQGGDGATATGGASAQSSALATGGTATQSSTGPSATGGNATGGNATARGGAVATGGKASQGGGSNAATGGAVGAGDAFRIIGYKESWTDNDLSHIQFDKLTHINYAFALPNDDGTFQAVPEEAHMDALVTRAHAAGVTVSLAFGGWNSGDDSAFHSLASTASRRSTFADAAFDYVEAHNLDGVDIDWEYPEEETAADYTALMAQLSARLKPAGKLLSAAVGSGSWIAAGIAPDCYQYFDYLMIMAYDDDSTNHSTYEFAASSLDMWLTTKAAPASKLVLGVPFYSSNYVYYSTIVAQNSAAAQLDQSNGEYYNGIPTIRRKTELAMQRASGVMIWELTQDTNDATSLLSTIYATAHP